MSHSAQLFMKHLTLCLLYKKNGAAITDDGREGKAGWIRL